MLRESRLFFSIILLAAVVCGVLFLNNDGARAQGDCFVQATKSAPGAGDLEFEFNGVDIGGAFTFFLQDGEASGGSTPVGTTTVITENPPSGWAFGGIECESSPNVIITEIESGFEVECANSGGEAVCVITNVRVAANIPTLSEWGMIAAAAGLGLIAVFFAVRKRLQASA